MSRGVALISGAGRGIGAGTARELGRRGYHVIVNYLRDAESAAAVVAGIEADGGSARTVRADVRDGEAVAAMIEEVRREHGRLDVLVCNANTVQPPFQPLAELEWERFADKVNGELAGVYHLTRRALEIMREQRAGRIVYVSSTAADMVGGSIAHSTAKAALNTFARHVAGDGARFGVTVNTVAAGAVDTDATADVFTDGIRSHLRSRSVLGRVLLPDDLGKIIATVADDAFGAATGQLIRVDGGFDVLEQVIGLAGEFESR
ncbi:3-oxoacyl-[acyl-carrier protein] reductase [Herbihabitans rhizosphaerae]|uniref:3-oxoacyl-[acyl-carrier protein] reductase n=1 Tax=Herbihabitans rhizosphaerae TaxID=1872711 RepID=A0A4Q7L6U5_9PSEU|nr:SDR family oxidoreductase [Herbihabitans rhizosphaerae]RZS44331.1 3-oxoacyl-[acyl-carrier protein] reductase [Herbihabitans rhizosphaerae]